MIGNDVVDLAAARIESNWKRKGFLQKVFTDAEQLIIRDAAQPDMMVWILWSMKESAYKIWNRMNGTRRFNPKSFECRIHYYTENLLQGEVGFGNLIYHSESVFNKELVHTVCRSPEYYNKRLHIRFTDRQEDFEKENAISRNLSGIPYRVNNDRVNDLISISHHGKFCSYLSTFKLG